MTMSRRHLIALVAAAAACAPSLGQAQAVQLDFLTAGPGSGFLPYGQGIAEAVNRQNSLNLIVKETKGSIDNLSGVEANASAIGTAFLGSAYEAINGIGPFAGRKHANLRAIAPMYETSFQIAARISSGLTTVAALSGKRVGVGPAGGPAEAFFKGLVEVAGLNLTIVNGTSAELEAAYLSGTIDAFWQGASIPIPALQRMATQTESIVFGLNAAEIEQMLKRFPYLSPGEVPAGTYKGQTGLIRSVAAWNIIIAHKDLGEPAAYALARAILSAPDIVALTKGAGVGTRASNAPLNTVIPYHLGAARYLTEAGVRVTSS